MDFKVALLSLSVCSGTSIFVRTLNDGAHPPGPFPDPVTTLEQPPEVCQKVRTEVVLTPKV